MKNYAIDRQVKGSNNFVSTGIIIPKSRQSKALKAAGILFPGEVVKVRLVQVSAQLQGVMA